jgi:hypothetical protein
MKSRKGCRDCRSRCQFYVKASHGCIQKEIQQRIGTVPIGNSVHVYQREALQDTNPAGNLKALSISCLVLPLDTFSYERKNRVKSLSGMAGIQGHIIRPLGPLGPPADAWLQSNTSCPLGEREMQTKPCLSSRGTETCQRHSGHWVLSTHEMKLNTLKVGLAALEGLLELLL